MKTLRSSVLLLSVCLLAPHAARAAFLLFNDTSTNETITVSANDFENGLSVNGALLQIGLGNPASITLTETNGAISFSGQWIDQGQTIPLTRTIYLVEAQDPTLISDILQYSLDTSGGFGHIQGSFVSDINDTLGHLPPGVPPGNVFIENGQAVNFGAPLLTAQIISDVDVPEPGAFSLWLIGLLGAGALRLRQQPRRSPEK